MIQTANDILRKHFRLQYDVKDGDEVPNDNIAHFWLICKDWPVIGSLIVLSRDEFNVLREVLDATFGDLHFSNNSKSTKEDKYGF